MTQVTFNEVVNALAVKYWDLKEGIDAREIDDKIKELEEIEELLNKGIGGKLRSQLEEEANRLRTVKAKRENASVDISHVTSELLDMTSDFAPSLDQRKDGIFPYDSEYEPISAQYYMAITDILFGRPKPAIQFKNAVMSDKGIEVNAPDADSLTALSILNYITTILQESAKKMLGRANKLDSSWKRLKEKDYAFDVFRRLNSNSEMSLKEMQDVCDREDEEYKGRITDLYDKRLEEALKYLTEDKWDPYLVEKYGDRYIVTDFGKWVQMLCGSEENSINEDEEGTEEKSTLRRITEFIRKYNVDRTKHR